MRRRRRRWIFAIIGLIIIASIAAYVLLTVPVNTSQTNARAGYTGEYTYITSYAGLSYTNKFSVDVTSVSRNTINFLYDQTEAANNITEIRTYNFSLAIDPSNPSTLESGSALPLFVANYLKPGNGTSELPAIGTEPAIPVEYSVSIASDLVHVNFKVGSQSGSNQTSVYWNLEYNQTTGFLISGFSTFNIVGNETFQYTLTSFSK